MLHTAVPIGPAQTYTVCIMYGGGMAGVRRDHSVFPILTPAPAPAPLDAGPGHKGGHRRQASRNRLSGICTVRQHASGGVTGRGKKPQPARLAGSGGEAVAEVAAARVVAVDYQCGPTESSHPKRGSSSSVPGVLAPSAGRCFSPSLCSSSGTAGASAPGTQCSCVDVLTPW